MKTVAFPTRLKLNESANFNAIVIKFKPPNQQFISANEKELVVIYLMRLSN